MVRIAVIVGTTRPGRKGRQVGDWVLEQVRAIGTAEYELLDLADQGLPLLDEAVPATQGRYEHEHTKRWAAVIDRFDGFIFVTAEYNHSVPGALKNALDFLYKEWNDKAAGFVGYGSALGARSIEHLRAILSELQVAHVRATVGLSLFEDFENFQNFKPRDIHGPNLKALVTQLEGWSGALRDYRTSRA